MRERETHRESEREREERERREGEMDRERERERGGRGSATISRSGKHRSVALAEMVKLALRGCRLPYVVACPPVEHYCSYWWRLAPCQRQAWNTRVDCALCGPAGSDAALNCSNM